MFPPSQTERSLPLKALSAIWATMRSCRRFSCRPGDADHIRRRLLEEELGIIADRDAQPARLDRQRQCCRHATRKEERIGALKQRGGVSSQYIIKFQVSEFGHLSLQIIFRFQISYQHMRTLAGQIANQRFSLARQSHHHDLLIHPPRHSDQANGGSGSFLLRHFPGCGTQ